MPSHAAHLLFALEALGQDFQDPTHNFSYFNRGAQLADVFYHNRRTHPSGLYISVALHRRGFALAVSHLVAHAQDPDELYEALSFLSHGVLDRFLHPWVNAFTGWYDPSHSGSMNFRFQHPLCERVIDVWICQKKQTEWMLGPEYSVQWKHPGTEYIQRLGSVLSQVFPRCKTDQQLSNRLENAFSDCGSYYQWSSNINENDYTRGVAELRKALMLRRDGTLDETQEEALRFGSLVHPRLAQAQSRLTALFEKESTEWVDPCHEKLVSLLNPSQLWNEALSEFKKLFRALGLDDTSRECIENWLNASSRPTIDGIYHALQDNGFHDQDLRSRTTSDIGCDLTVCTPIDWFAVWMELEEYTDTSIAVR